MCVYSNVGMGFKVKRNLTLVAVCRYQEIRVHKIEISALSYAYFSEIISGGGFATINSTIVNNSNTLPLNDYLNLDRMAEVSSQKKEESRRKATENRKCVLESIVKTQKLSQKRDNLYLCAK